MKFLMINYGIGAALTFWTVAIMYRHALKRKEELDLDEFEIFQTRPRIGINALMGAILIASLMVAWLGPDVRVTFAISGFMYMLYPIVMPLYGRYLRKKELRLFPVD